MSSPQNDTADRRLAPVTGSASPLTDDAWESFNRQTARELMRVCYDEANRLANHGSNGLEKLVMSQLYDAANDAKKKLNDQALAQPGRNQTVVQPFIADEAPLGTTVQIGCDTPDERIARSEFHRYLFQYFEQLTSGQTGWGVDFNAWLEMARGWKHHGRKKYERIMSIGEMIDSEPNDQTVRAHVTKPNTP